LEIYAEGDQVVQVSGLLDGKKVENRTQCIGKNFGRSNETTPEEQAISQAEAKIASKLQEGYFETLEEVKGEEVILPMLAKVYEKEVKKIEWPCYVQPKLDGMRGLPLSMNLIQSRTGREIENLEHLHNELHILRETLGTIPDGELYAHGLTFQENMTIIKKYRQGKTELVKFHVYDCIHSHSFFNRYDALMAAFKMYDYKHIELVPTYRVNGEKDMLAYHKQFIEEGYEGTMVRWGKEGYKLNARSSNLLKYKIFLDKQFIVLDIEASEARPGQGIVVCEGFKASMAMPHSTREEVLANKQDYIGRMAEIRYFEETDEGLPRFPVCHGFRDDK
jgi:DNA ligase-1